MYDHWCHNLRSSIPLLTCCVKAVKVPPRPTMQKWEKSENFHSISNATSNQNLKPKCIDCLQKCILKYNFLPLAPASWAAARGIFGSTNYFSSSYADVLGFVVPPNELFTHCTFDQLLTHVSEFVIQCSSIFNFQGSSTFNDTFVKTFNNSTFSCSCQITLINVFTNACQIKYAEIIIWLH